MDDGCLYVDVNFGTSAEYFMLACLGPIVPYYSVYATPFEVGEYYHYYYKYFSIIIIIIISIYIMKRKLLTHFTSINSKSVEDY